jgi:hypothetical protein
MPRGRRAQLQALADGVDQLLLESDPPTALVTGFQRWIDAHPESWTGTGWHTTFYRPHRWHGIEHWPVDMPTRPDGEGALVPCPEPM